MVVLGRTFTKADMRRVIWTAVAAAIVAEPVLVAGMKSDKKAAIMAFAITVGSAAFTALKNWWLSDDSPVK